MAVYTTKQIMEIIPLNELAGRGLVTLTEDTVAPTERGLAFWNDVAESLVFSS